MKRTLRRAFAGIFCILILLALAGCGKDDILPPAAVAEYGFTPPEGFTAADETAQLYHSPDYPDDIAVIYTARSAADPYFGSYTADMMAEALSRMLSAEYGTEIPVAVENFIYTEVDGLPAYRMQTSYAVGDLQLRQLVVAVNADACYTFTWTCTPEEDWMAAFAESADSLWFRLQ